MSIEKTAFEGRKHGVDVVPTVEAVLALDGRIFAMLTSEENKALQFYRDQGRKYGVAVSIISKADTTELAEAASEERADEILRRSNSVISIKKIFVDEADRAVHFSPETILTVTETNLKN